MRKTPSLNDLAYTHICRLLVEDRILPNQRLSEQNLAKEIGMSRTPVREAIRRLQSEGILYQRPSSGTYVVSPSPDDVQELYEIREALECYLARKAIPQMNHLDYMTIRRTYEEMKGATDEMQASGAPYLIGEPLSRFLKADWSFHRQLIEAAGNRHALKILDDTQLKGCVYGIRSHRRNMEHLSRVLYVHKQIAVAAKKNKVNAAVHWLRTHIRESCRDAMAAIHATTSLAGEKPATVFSVIMNNDRK